MNAQRNPKEIFNPYKFSYAQQFLLSDFFHKSNFAISRIMIFLMRLGFTFLVSLFHKIVDVAGQHVILTMLFGCYCNLLNKL
jgi:NRPS condensation-like uncharacterized protein